MRLTTLTIAAVLSAGAAFAAFAADVAPGDVVFDEGSVAASLTRTPGDPAKGEKVYASKNMGNCVACHLISSVDVAFPGNVGPELDGVGDRYDEPGCAASWRTRR